MDTLLITGRLILALVFSVSGIAKLVDISGFRRSLREFGVPNSLTTILGLVLSVVELGLAAALLSTRYAWWGAVGATLLLLIFIAAISVSLYKGVTPSCRCFGQLFSGSAGLTALIRNEMLAAVSALLIWQAWDNAGPSFLTVLSGLTAVQLLRITVVLALIGLFATRRFIRWPGTQRTKLLKAGANILGTSAATSIAPVAGPPVGTLAPDFALATLDGGRLDLRTILNDGKPVMLVFVDPECDPCRILLWEIGTWRTKFGDAHNIAVISRAVHNNGSAQGIIYPVSNVLLQQDNEIARAYGVAALPGAVMIQADGMVASRLAIGGDAIRTLFFNLTKTQPGQALFSYEEKTKQILDDPPPCSTCGKSREVRRLEAYY